MNTTPKNVPIRGSAWEKSAKAGPPLAALLAVLGLLVFARGAWALTMFFDTSKYSGDVWLQIQDPFGGTANKFQATYNNGASAITFGTHQTSDNPPQTVTNLMSNPVKLSAIGTGGLNVTYSLSCVFFLFYDDPSATTGYLLNAPGPFDTLQRYQQFEMTLLGNPGDQGNLTNIDCFTAPLSIRSYQNNPLTNPSEPVLQSTGYGSNTAKTIVPLLASASGGAAAAVKKDTSGKLLRYIGPSKYDPGNTSLPTNPWPSFVPYAQSLVGATTSLKRANSFGGPAWTPADTTPEKQLYTFGMDMTATTDANGVITVSGKITAAVANPGAVISPNPALPTDGAWTNVTVTLSPTTGTHGHYDYDAAIYGQAGSAKQDATNRWYLDNKAISLGADWENFQTFCINTRADPSKPHDTSTNKSLQDLGAYITTQNMVIGEITTGLLGGFYGSTHEVMYNGSLTPIGNIPSEAWWQLNPRLGFSQIQSVATHYNQYANVIWTTSGNTVYGIPFSDRFGSGPLVNTVKSPGPNPVDVGYWVIGVGAPVGAPTGGAGPAATDLLLLNNQ